MCTVQFEFFFRLTPKRTFELNKKYNAEKESVVAYALKKKKNL